MIRWGISSTGSTRSTKPAATALAGMSAKRGRVRFAPWATVNPPFSLIALRPSVPSLPPPDNTTPNCALSLIFGKGGEEDIDRRPLSLPSREVPKTEPPRADVQGRAGRKNIDMLRFDPLTVSCVDYRHTASAADDLGQQAIAVRREVGDNHKSDAVVRRHGSEERFQRLYPARRSADADDGKMRRHSSDPQTSTLPSINADPRLGDNPVRGKRGLIGENF